VKFHKNDIIQNGSSIAHVLSYDGGWYFVRWLDAGDGMLCAGLADKKYKKVMHFVPGSMDELVFNGHVKFKR